MTKIVGNFMIKNFNLRRGNNFCLKQRILWNWLIVIIEGINLKESCACWFESNCLDYIMFTFQNQLSVSSYN